MISLLNVQYSKIASMGKYLVFWDCKSSQMYGRVKLLVWKIGFITRRAIYQNDYFIRVSILLCRPSYQNR